MMQQSICNFHFKAGKTILNAEQKKPRNLLHTHKTKLNATKNQPKALPISVKTFLLGEVGSFV